MTEISKQLPVHSALDRFRPAHAAIFQRALEEISRSHKQSHWMWCIFPQLRGLGHSYRANYYGIVNTSEALAYLQDPELGDHLRQITKALVSQPENNVHTIFGSPDNKKLHSCLTLFNLVAQDENERQLFHAALNKFFAGKLDTSTINIMQSRDDQLKHS